jgi:TP901 family phage tail tape measure protein
VGASFQSSKHILEINLVGGVAPSLNDETKKLQDGIQGIGTKSISAKGMLKSAFTSLGMSAGAAGLAVSGITTALKLVGKVAKAAFGAVVNLIKSGLEEAVKFEDAMTRIAKVLPNIRLDDGSLSPYYEKYSQGIIQLGIEIPDIDAYGIADIVEQGARGGIVDKGASDEERYKQLMEYAKQTAIMASAWEVDAETAGEITRDWRSKLGFSTDEMVRIGDLINYLDNNTQADASEIAKFITETGGQAKGLGFTVDQMAAIATIFGAGGYTGDASALATTMNSMMGRIASGGAQQQGLFKKGAAMIGYNDPEALSLEFAKKPIETFVEVLEKINNLDGNKAGAVRMLFGSAATNEIWTVLNNLGKVPELLGDLKNGNYAGSMQTEFEFRSQTASASYEEMQAYIQQFELEIGQMLLPQLKEFWDNNKDDVKEAIDRLGDQLPELFDAIFGEDGFLDVMQVTFDRIMWFVEKTTNFIENLRNSFEMLVESPVLAVFKRLTKFFKPILSFMGVEIDDNFFDALYQTQHENGVAYGKFEIGNDIEKSADTSEKVIDAIGKLLPISPTTPTKTTNNTNSITVNYTNNATNATTQDVANDLSNNIFSAFQNLLEEAEADEERKSFHGGGGG